MTTKRHHIKDFQNSIKNICSYLQIPVLEIPDGDKKKRSIVALIDLNSHTVRVETHAVYTKEEISVEDATRLNLTLINAEEYFTDYNELWVGDIKKVFSDYSITLENKFGHLVWCGTPYRSTMEEFYVDLNQPVMVTNYHTGTLEKLSSGKALLEFTQLGLSSDDLKQQILKDKENVRGTVTFGKDQ